MSDASRRWNAGRSVAGWTGGESRRVIAIVLCLLLLVTGCSKMPTTGPVGMSENGATPANRDPEYFIPQNPGDDATPQQIIEGFFNAGSGPQDDYSVARLFLAPGAALSWKPSQRTLVYRGSPEVVQSGGENEYDFSIDVARTVDQDGISEEHPAGNPERVKVSLIEVDGQWRLSEVPDGIIIPEETFKVLYRAYPVYFFDPSYAHLVPDMRWFIGGSTVAKSLVSALLAGPAAYLRPAVVSAFPSGMGLERESVPVVDGVAEVDLTRELRDTSILERQRMRSQLSKTFVGVPSIAEVTLRTGQSEVSVEDPSSKTPYTEPVSDPKVPGWQIAVYGDELVQFTDQAARIEGLVSVAEFGPRFPAASSSRSVYAFLGDDLKSLYTVLPGQPARLIEARAKLSPPSVDPYDWVWSAGPGAQGKTEAVAFNPRGTPEGAEPKASAISAPWLAGRVVKDLRISRDGARALVLTERAGTTALHLSGVVRNSEGAPSALTNPQTIQTNTTDADRALWIDETTVLVTATSTADTVSPEIVRFRGDQPKRFPGLTGLASVSAGNGEQEVYAQTSTNLYQLGWNTWTELGKGVRDPAFAG